MPSLYLHIPFCRQACHYCNFHFSTTLNYLDELIQAISKEILLRKDFLGETELSSVYFGGGTPSILKREHFEILWEAISKTYLLKKSAEITLEVNPDDINPGTLSVWKIFPFNRLSIGIQSFDNNMLKYLNRIHNVEQIEEGFNLTRNAGFENINIDLIYGIPNQTEIQWHSTLEKTLQLNPEHVSAYCLTVEEKTALYSFITKGKSPAISEETGARHFEWLMKEMRKHGYYHYEISNFCKPGYESRHNLGYWRGENYLGVGPGAHSFKKNIRQWNIANNLNYLKSLEKGILPYQSENLTKENLLTEYILLGLRTADGCDLSYIKQMFHTDLLGEKSESIMQWESKNLIRIVNERIALTDVGRIFADKIALELL